MERRLTFDLHLLTARMDRSADRMLMAEYGLSYRRFLALLIVGEHTVEKCQRLLERRFARLVQRSGVPYDEYAGYTQRLLAAFQETDRTHLLASCTTAK